MVNPLGRFSAVLLIAACACQPEAPDDPPNVVLLMADDMGWAQTGYYGHPLLNTPHLDAMARAGLRMDRFYAGAPSCTPTRATVITGRTNDRTGAFRVGDSINKQEKTLATAFRQAGYLAAHFGKWHLNRVNPIGDNPLPNIDYGPEHPGIRPDTTGHLRGFKKDFYEGGLRVPTIIEWPRGIAPRTSNFPRQHHGHLPDADRDRDARSEVDQRRKRRHLHRPRIRLRARPQGSRPSAFAPAAASPGSTTTYKLMRNYTSDTPDAYELYNLIGDPQEQQNLIEQQPELAGRMRSELDAWNRSVDKSVTGADYPEGRVLPSGREARGLPSL